jgi:tRNA (guanosine-2'-O-)-methyltransferase
MIGKATSTMMIFFHVCRVQSFSARHRILPSFQQAASRFSFTTASTSTTELHGARKSTRARKRDQAKLPDNDSTSTTLEWETFEFGDSPKWDQRFDDNSVHIASNTENWQDIEDREAEEDVALQQKFEKQHQLWEKLDPSLVEEATQILLPYITPERWSRIQEVVSKRTRQTRFLFENPANPSNVWACLRTLDSFGIQHVDVVIQSGKYQGKAALTQKRGMRTAMGSAKWLTLKNHLSTRHALQHLKDQGYHVVCTDVNPESKDIRDFDWDVSGKKVCVVMGNEQYGISDEVKSMADESFYLPMVGMAESFNLSVATAITCAHLSAASGQEVGKGPLRSGDLSEEEYKTLLLKGALNTVKHKVAQALFRRAGLNFPKDLNIS